jgi:hypothetical protein
MLPRPQQGLPAVAARRVQVLTTTGQESVCVFHTSPKKDSSLWTCIAIIDFS